MMSSNENTVPTVSPFLFRLITVVSTLLPLLGPVIDRLLWPDLPIERSRLRDPALNAVFLSVATANMILGIVSTVGLCLFKRWSRTTAVVGTLIGLAVYPMASYFISTGLKVSTDSLSLLLDGAVIALAYWSPLARRFEGSRSAPVSG